jgi:hypothetical protein
MKQRLTNSSGEIIVRTRRFKQIQFSFLFQKDIKSRRIEAGSVNTAAEDGDEVQH